MLKKRILASSMASVMALTSVSLVAFAEETTDFEAVETVTKENLNEMVEGLINQKYEMDVLSFKSKKIYEFGQTMSGYLRNALDYVVKVANGGSVYDNVDATAAYQMVKAVVKRARIYTAEELQRLMDGAKEDYDGKNKLNIYSDDLIFTATSYATFKNAYERAKSVVKSTSSSAITDTYVILEDAINGLKRKKQVSKTEFDKALSEFEAALNPVKFDAWRRGYISLNKSDLQVSDYYSTYDGLNVAWGTFVHHVAKILPQTQQSQQTLNNIKGVSVTTNDNIVADYRRLLDGKVILEGFAADDTDFAVRYSIEELLQTYQSRLAYEFEGTQLAAVIAALNGLGSAANIEIKGVATAPASTAGYAALTNVTAPALAEVKYNGKRLAAASLTVKITDGAAAAEFCYATDSDGKLYSYNAGANFAIANSETALRATLGAAGDQNIEKLVYHTMKDGTAAVNILDILKVDFNNVVDANEAQYHWSNGVIDGDAGANTNGLAAVAVPGGGAVAVPADNAGAIANKNIDRGFGFKWKNDATGFESRMTLIGRGGATDTVGEEGISWADTTALSSYYTGVAGGVYNYNIDCGTRATYPLISTAMDMAQSYLAVNWIAANIDAEPHVLRLENIIDATMDTKGTFSALAPTDAAGTQAAAANTYVKYDFDYDSADLSTIIYRYLKYALEDRYAPEQTVSHHTRPEVEELVVKADALTADCVVAPIFSAEVKSLAVARQHAKQWLSASYNDYLYNDNGSAPLGVVVDVEWDNLSDEYEALLKKYNAWRYSYEEIIKTMNEVATGIEANDANQMIVTQELKDALSECAYRLSLVKPDSVYGIYNAAFDNARNFNGINRLRTDGNDADPTHEDLTNAYKALLKAQEDANPANQKGELGDVNGDGKVNSVDALTILKSIVDLLEDGDKYDASVADYNADGKIDSTDALAILKTIAGL